MHDYKVVNGKVKDTVTGKVVKGLKVCKGVPSYFVGDNSTRIALGGNWDETIEAIIDYDEKKLGGAYPGWASEPGTVAAWCYLGIRKNGM